MLVVEKFAAESGFHLKEQQKETLVQFTSGKDVCQQYLVNLYAICFLECLMRFIHMIFKKSIIVIVSPLLMSDLLLHAIPSSVMAKCFTFCNLIHSQTTMVDWQGGL